MSEYKWENDVERNKTEEIKMGAEERKGQIKK